MHNQANTMIYIHKNIVEVIVFKLKIYLDLMTVINIERAS